MEDYAAVTTEGRILMGAGPSDVHPRVLRAMGMPIIGHLDPELFEIVNHTKDLLAQTFETANDFTIPIAGTGTAAMEAALINFIEPGDKVLICVSGLFGERMVDIAQRCGGDLEVLEAEWGKIIEPSDVERALSKRPAKVVAIVHAETSTGVLQPIKPIANIAHKHGAILVVDAVTSLAGAPVRVDETGIDVCFSAAQKCLSCPPGLAPITVGARAMEILEARKTKLHSLYLDLKALHDRWGHHRFYHHTAPVNMLYGLCEGLKILHDEGLEASFRRHELGGKALRSGLEAMGLSLFAQEAYRSPMITTVWIPDGVDDVRVRKHLMDNYRLEISPGLGSFKGKIWRVGLMGRSCARENVMLFLAALEEALIAEGFSPEQGAGIAGAREVYAR
ncbi:MAG: pyridoxal-phosphate-dependent aminotransferase family protein [Bacillota bacterium]